MILMIRVNFPSFSSQNLTTLELNYQQSIMLYHLT